MSKRFQTISRVLLLVGVVSLVAGCHSQSKQSSDVTVSTRSLDEIVQLAITEVMGEEVKGEPEPEVTLIDENPAQEVELVEVIEVKAEPEPEVTLIDENPAQEVELVEVIEVKIPVRIVVGLPEGSTVPTTASTEDFSAFKSAVRNGSRDEIRGMLESNRVIMLPKFTRAMELERIGDLARIEVLDGPMDGRQLWISTLWLR